MKELVTVKCKMCGQEYLPSEIFYPKAFFGTQKEIIKKPDGTIDFYIGDDPDYDEEFVCEHCGAKLKIHANLSFDVNIKEQEDEDFVAPLNKPKKIQLEESSIISE